MMIFNSLSPLFPTWWLDWGTFGQCQITTVATTICWPCWQKYRSFSITRWRKLPTLKQFSSKLDFWLIFIRFFFFFCRSSSIRFHFSSSFHHFGLTQSTGKYCLVWTLVAINLKWNKMRKLRDNNTEKMNELGECFYQSLQFLGKFQC